MQAANSGEKFFWEVLATAEACLEGRSYFRWIYSCQRIQYNLTAPKTSDQGMHCLVQGNVRITAGHPFHGGAQIPRAVAANHGGADGGPFGLFPGCRRISPYLVVYPWL
jgi:hypothetical protein